MHVLALDAMGGDLGPEMVVEGAYLAMSHVPCDFLFFGDQDQILPLLKKYPTLSNRSSIVHTPHFIASDAKPSSALRKGRFSSLGLAIQSVKDKETCAVVSAGNTGAYMALSKILLKMLPGIDRPCIPAVIPTLKGECVVLDLGANIDCTPDILKQFSVMGIAFSSCLLKKKNPSLGILNIGTENLKGPALLHETRVILENISSINFLGFVEDVMKGEADVVVTDGFSGNIVLKAIEGTARFVKSALKKELEESWRGRIGYTIAKSSFLNFQDRLDPRRYNGAVFLGLQHTAVKSHGGSDAFGFANAISVAYHMKDFVDYFKEDPIFQKL